MIELIFLFLFCFNAQAALQLPPNAKPISSDPFSVYQWALQNQGQIQVDDINDTKSERVPGKVGVDLGWNSKLAIESLMKRDVVVAVIDSGIDLDHEELKGSIALNSAECINGNVPSPAKLDKDNNGYVGDCKGWDFTTETNGLKQRPYDDIGHGTHLSGIIAANADNSVGIRGLSNRIKILPLKVMSSKEEQESNPVKQQQIQLQLADRVARAVQYASSRKVDVINLSLGWPAGQDSPVLHDAFAKASEQGILIVAAAGNNSIGAPVFPCAYENVICVGALSVEGKIARYSNYGGHVDFLAPGDEILSTIPNKIDSIGFGIKGYDYMSGSSQAAAYISAVAAIAKGLHPEQSIRELYANIANSCSETPFSEHKFTLHGVPNLSRLVGNSSTQVIQPDFKTQDKILFHLGDSSTVFPLKIQNLSSNSAENILVTVQSTKGPVSISANFKLSLASQSDSILSIPAQIVDPEADNQVEFSVTINYLGKSEVFRQSLVLVRELTVKDSVKVLPIVSVSADSISSVVKGKLIPSLHTVPDKYYRLGASEYYSYTQNGSDFSLSLFRVLEDKLQIVNTFSLKNTKSFLQLNLVDSQLQGELGYLLFTMQSGADGKPYLQFTHLNKQLQPAIGDKSSWSYIPEKVAAQPRSFTYLGKTVPGIGRVSVPVQILNGQIPSLDQSKDPFASSTDASDDHLYYFDPIVSNGSVNVSTRIIDNSTWLIGLAKYLGLSWRDKIMPIIFLPQTPDEFRKGSARLLISAGRESLLRYYVLSIGGLDPDQISTISLTALPESYSIDRAVFSDHYVVGESVTPSLFAFPVAAQRYPGARLRWSSIDLASSSVKISHLELSDLHDEIQALLAVYKTDGSERAYTLTSNAAIEQVLSTDGTIVENYLPVARFSFVSPSIINKIYSPIYGGDRVKSFPAFFADTSSINSNYTYVLSAKSGSLSIPANLSIQVPDGCATMNPGIAGEQRLSVEVLFCRQGNSAELRQLPIQ